MARLDSREAAHAWLVLRGARALVSDSRSVTPGDAFVAWPGRASDGRRYVGAALAAGASACIVEADGVEGFDLEREPRVAALHGLKAAAGDVASRFLGAPSEQLDVVAVTGTNGKTSTAWWIAQALGSVGRRAGVIGTLGIGEPPRRDSAGELRSTGLTTPDPVMLQNALRDFVDRGFTACTLEASSIGIVEHRLAGTRVAVAVFTNFSQDHLDYHGDMRAYWAAKAQLFAWPGLRAAVVNLDDAQGVELATTLAERELACWTISTRGEDARLRAVDLRHGRDGLAFDVVEGDDRVAIAAPLIGDYNASNLLCTIGALRALGIPLAAAARACAALTPVPGRMQRVVADAAEAAPEIVVDYAHTPDALEKALAALAPLARARGGKLWCVFGCGGNRDAAKRPLMGAIACRLANRVVLTSDNPRHESPDLVLAQILAGAIGHDEVDVIENRADAIRHAVGSAAAEDVVLLAGKGHEDYQEIAGARLPFSDARHAHAALVARSAGGVGALAAKATMTTLAEAARLVPGAQLVGSGTTSFARVHSDTRSIAAGDLFVALRGERFDAHAFLGDAKARGAVAALAERGLDESGLPGLLVADSRRALGDFAAAWRRRFTMPLVTVAGSNGKTTVTQMIAAMFRAWVGDAAFSTQGNFNNDVGLPLTLLGLRQGCRAAVVELGMNHVGEIARLAQIAAPTIALVNNAQREHLEFMSSVDAVARENGSAIEALGADGVAVFPADDAHAATWREIAGDRRVVTFALDDTGADVSASATWHGDHSLVQMQTPAGAAAFALHVAGVHNVRNALAASAAALAAGCPLDAIVRGLESFRAVRGRSQTKRIVRRGSEATLIDDTYNANPDSARAAIDVLAALPAPRWLVLGDMGEVGDQGPAFHREVGAYAHERGIESLWAVGAESANTVAGFAGARAFLAVEELIAALDEAPQADSILVKGSRFMRMERVVAALTGETGDPHA
ncbi:MAG TPA: bifunctional UDP-N-acetylmuramoyl-L-alanyl-D-glutamate--2,6-diaminopimelate ligase MurE/UDP-N-acetylmuramoyl-tripeptide--D-alanyl-D-alanine ligase MurF [Caldimonas sp.]|nr:bifunctional UDP-N-acetylmuramoyl-L-alanyl-D-glutamate--2,6-diaminopimelate ligase MurE/UDP-N-acetylmuramoyl-tripeptide--D-alanyl-D-alanine ligase MurF [Caldimonas sp.]